MCLKEYLGLGEKGVVSIVGAGGKTSLLFALARELSGAGRTVLTTTTTKIFKPSPDESSFTLASKDPTAIATQARTLLKNNYHLSAGAYVDQASGKLIGLEPALIETIEETGLFDYILIEADGAARKPLKACAENEPVVPRFTDIIVYMVGLDVIGKPLEERWVFRSKLFSNRTGLPFAHPVTEESVAKILLHDLSQILTDKSNSKRIAFLNKAENNPQLESGKHIAALVKAQNGNILNRILVGALQEVPVIAFCTDLGADSFF